MGRVVTAISYAEDSEFAQILKEMKRKGKNVSQTLVSIVERHIKLYDEVEGLKKKYDERNDLFLKHSTAAARMKLFLYPSALGYGYEYRTQEDHEATIESNRRGIRKNPITNQWEKYYPGEEE